MEDPKGPGRGLIWWAVAVFSGRPAISSTPRNVMPSLTGLLLVNPRARLGQSDLALAVASMEKVGIRLIRPARPLEVWEFPEYTRSEGTKSDFVVVGGGDGP